MAPTMSPGSTEASPARDRAGAGAHFFAGAGVSSYGSNNNMTLRAPARGLLSSLGRASGELSMLPDVSNVVPGPHSELFQHPLHPGTSSSSSLVTAAAAPVVSPWVDVSDSTTAGGDGVAGLFSAAATAAAAGAAMLYDGPTVTFVRIRTQPPVPAANAAAAAPGAPATAAVPGSTTRTVLYSRVLPPRIAFVPLQFVVVTAGTSNVAIESASHTRNTTLRDVAIVVRQ